MKPIFVRSLAVAATVLLAVAGTVAAQEKATGLLSRPEVQQLVARAEPTDNARLAVHFIALADRYAAEAKRHIAMSQSFAGNPNRSLGSGMSTHCKRLADLNTQEATTVRELAAYHDTLAGGTTATPPRDGARFQGGAGAPEPTKSEVTALALKAGTPAEHKALEEYFRTLAKRYAAAAEEHVALAQTYRGTKIAQAAVMQDRLAQLDRDTVKEATAAADMHKQLATTGR